MPALRNGAASITPTSPGWPGMLAYAHTSFPSAPRHRATDAPAAIPSIAGTSTSRTTLASVAGGPDRDTLPPLWPVSLAGVGARFGAIRPWWSTTDWSIARRLDDQASRWHPRDDLGPRPLLAPTLAAAGDVGGACRPFHSLSCGGVSEPVRWTVHLRRAPCRPRRAVGRIPLKGMMAVPGHRRRWAEIKLPALRTRAPSRDNRALTPRVRALIGSLNTRHPPAGTVRVALRPIRNHRSRRFHFVFS